MRALSDDMVVLGAQQLSKHFDEMLELGSGGSYYKDLLKPIMAVRTSNIVAGCDEILDMTNIALLDDSQNLLMSAFAIEHFFEVEKSFSEAARVLRSGGVYFLIAPFLYYFHAAPDDYFRFTNSALRRLAEKHGFTVESEVVLGDRWLMMSEFMHEKAVLGSKHGKIVRLGFRLAALPLLLLSILRGQSDQRFAMGFAVALRKQSTGALP